MNKTKIIIATILVLLLVGLGFWLIFKPAEEQAMENQESLKVILQAQKILGFELNQMEGWKSEIAEFKKIDEQQEQFKLKFSNPKNKATIELFQSINVINPEANITGFDPNVREKTLVNNSQEIEKLEQIEGKNYGLVLSNSDTFFNSFTYSLIDLDKKEQSEKQTSYTLETDLFKLKNFDNLKYTVKTTITINLREANKEKREEQKTEAKKLIQNLKRQDSKQTGLNYIKENTNSPFGKLDLQQTNQDFKPEHQAIDIVPNKEYYKTDLIYQETGLEVFYSVCEGVASPKLDNSQALVIELKCNNSDTTFEYWHNQTNFVFNNQTVKKGQVLGIVGETGNSHGRHLHFVGFENGERKDPKILLENLKI